MPQPDDARVLASSNPPEAGLHSEAANVSPADDALTHSKSHGEGIEPLAESPLVCVLAADRDAEAFAALPDCEACEGTGKDLPPDWRGASSGTTGSTPVAAEPVGDGPGWTRCGIEHLIGMMRAYARTEAGEMPVTVNDAAEVDALLADRDRLSIDVEQAQDRVALRESSIGELARNVGYWSAMARDRAAERDAARTELAEVTADLKAVRVEAERLRTGKHLASCIWIDPGRMSGAPCLGGTRIRVDTIAGLLAEGLDGGRIRESYPDVTDEHLTAVQHFVDEVDGSDFRELFELQYTRMGEATKLWRAEAPQDRALIQPDLGALLKWLMDRTATARRDAAADALEHAAGIAKRIAGGEEVYRDLCIAAAQVRMGQRSIPASNLGQEADDGQG